MAGNTTLIEVKDRGWLNGFEPLWRKENHGWWGTWSWLVKILVWTAIIDGMLALVMLMSQVEAGKAEEPLEQTALMIYFIFAGIVPACGVIIFGHETLIDERKMGTAAWVLSKPVSRAAFLLSKFFADALGVLTTMVLVQGLVAYFIYKASTGIWLSIPGFLAGLGLIYLFLIFFLALTLMLSTLFHSRGPVIGIPLVFISCSYLAILVPWLGKVMPSSLILSLESGQPSLAEALAQGQPLQTVTPILATVLLVILFILVALVRFGREEF
jgi:ABC-2 type transport system permease protein